LIEEETQLIEIMEAGFPTLNPICRYVSFYIRKAHDFGHKAMSYRAYISII
jgi:hypothetical protein